MDLRHSRLIDSNVWNDYNDTSGYNPLFLAVHNGEINLLPSLLKNYSATEKINGKTLINVAAARGHEEIVRLLINKDTDRNSPLHIAIKENQSSVFHLLIKEYNVNVKNRCDETPLHYAALYDRVDFAKILIENGASVNARDNQDKTPLYNALKKENVPLVNILLKNSAVLTEQDNNRWNPLSIAADSGNLEMVKLLMNNGWHKVDVPDNTASPLYTAAVWGHLKIVKYMMKNGSKSNKTITEDGLNLFHPCMKQGRKNMLKYLIEAGLKTKVQLLDEISYWKWHKVWTYLLTCRSKVDANTFFKETQLHWAVRDNQVETVKVIVDQQARTVKSDSLACKLAVYIAVENEKEDILQVLLNAGYSTESCFADIGLLHLAATFEHTRLVEALLKVGADVNAETAHGLTPLHFAAAAGRSTVVKLLLESGANPLKCSKEREEPLPFALDMFSSIASVDPFTFTNLVQITKMLISQKVRYFYQLLVRVIRIYVHSEENKRNSTLISNSKEETSPDYKYDNDEEDDEDYYAYMYGNCKETTTQFREFRPEIVICVFNYLANYRIKTCSQTILENDLAFLDRSLELVHVMMEYNDSKSCCDIEFKHLRVNYKCQLFLIDYSGNVDNLIEVRINFSSKPNDEVKVNETVTLKLIIARLVLLTNSHDSKVTEFCRKHKLLDWRKECELQKVKMQQTKIADNFNVSFHDLFSQSVNTVANYVRHENFCKIVESSSAKFPAYTDFLKLRIEKGMRRKDLRDECANLMHNLIRKNYKIWFFDADLDQIFRYLSTVDLRRFSAAFS